MANCARIELRWQQLLTSHQTHTAAHAFAACYTGRIVQGGDLKDLMLSKSRAW
jgi:hypothetical protein